MKYRKQRLGRLTRRRRFLLQLLASMSVGTGSLALAQETQLAHYSLHPSEETNAVQLVAAEQQQAFSFRSILQAHALQEAEPQQEELIPSSSDMEEDEFLFLAPPAPDAKVDEDIDAIVDQSLTPVPIEEPFSEFSSDLFDGPVINPPTAPPVPPQMAAPVGGRRSLGAVASSYSAAPNMIGDFFGGTFLLGSLLGATVSLAGGDRRFKVAENVSPIPQDRILFNYNHFHNALLDINDEKQSLDRFTFGFEKTVLAGTSSIEVRLPFGHGLDSSQAFGADDTQGTELGNLALAFKTTLLSGCHWMVSAGTTMTLPTGDDFALSLGGNGNDLLIQNEAVHLAPFLGFIAQPNPCWFAQGFVQADFDLNGNDVFTSFGGFEGTLQDQNLLFIDASIGRWLHRSCDPCARFSGVAAIAELHYTTTMNDTDGVVGISNPFNRMDILNATGALNFQFGKTSLRVGGAAPLRQDEEHLFDAEVLVQLNRNY